MSDNRIYIFDTTLRDGQQSPGAGMSFEDNLHYARYADLLGIDILEAGFPAASETDFQIVHAIANEMTERNSKMTIAGLCQLREEQLIKTMEALKPALANNRARVHTYVPVDPHLMEASLGALAHDKPRIIAELHRLISLATQEGFEVEFSPEGYSRMANHFDFTSDLIRSAVAAGAKIINCPDTIGGASSLEAEHYFVKKMQAHADLIKQEFPQSNIIWSTHCHNDFGLALSNSIHAVFDGPARQIEGCINGIGERAGNAALEQCIMFIKEFGSIANPHQPYYTEIHCEYLQDISDFVSSKMLPRQPHSPIVGENAAKHTSGGHTNAILKNPLAYQPFDPKMIGSEISFVFGPLSGGNHAQKIIQAQGYQCTDQEKAALAQLIKDFYKTRRKGITDQELMDAYLILRAPIQLEKISYAKTNEHTTTLSLEGKFFDQTILHVCSNSNNSALASLAQAVDAVFPGLEIFAYHSNSGGHSVNADCHTHITIKNNQGHYYQGKAIDSDIEIAALKAFINAVNQAYIEMNFKNKEIAHA